MRLIVGLDSCPAYPLAKQATDFGRKAIVCLFTHLSRATTGLLSNQEKNLGQLSQHGHEVSQHALCLVMITTYDKSQA